MFRYKLFRLSLIFIALFLIIGCGADEESVENEVTKPLSETIPPNYYPDSIGSRWVYRSPSGFQWTREVTGKKAIAGQVYRVFDYIPPRDDSGFDFLKTPSYRITRNRVFFFVGGEVDQSVKRNLSKSLERQFADAGNIRVNVIAASQSNLTFFRIPPFPGQKWEVLDMRITGNVVFLDLANFKLRFEINWVITGFVDRKETVETPAGTFPDSFKVQYSTKVTTLVEGEEETSRDELETVWLAPDVGMVKIEDEDGVTELIEYTISDLQE